MKRGGGACGEHSHAINLWQTFANISGIGRIIEVTANLEYINEPKVDYDSICLLNFRTETGVIGRVVQDVITRPTKKWARAQCDNGYIEWNCEIKPGLDTVVACPNEGEKSLTEISKTRPDDFFQEMKHISDVFNSGTNNNSPISLERGLDTMLVIAGAHMSQKNSSSVVIDYKKDYSLNALSLKK